MAIPPAYEGLFQFFRFCYPIMDAIRATCFPQLLSVAEGTVLSWVHVRGEALERLRIKLNEDLGAALPPSSLTEEMTVGALCSLLAQHGPQPKEADFEGFFQEFPNCRD